jgi:DNA polymerase-3 subunit delta'
MSWDSIIGQRRTKVTLRAALASRRIPHAWLFTGPEGVGKDAAAIEVAKVLRCENPRENGTVACDACRGCVSTGALRNNNVRFVFALPSGKGENARADAPMLKLSEADLSVVQGQVAMKAADPYHNISIPKAQQIKISSIREVKRDISFSANESGWRIVIISEAHQMGEEAANAFLKTLEEPNKETLLILTTSSPERILPTIRSRCQEVRFDLLSDEGIAEALVARTGADAIAAGVLAKLAEGSYSRAVDLHSGDLNALRHDVVSFLRTALRRSPLMLYSEIERLTSGNDRAHAERVLMLLALWLRDVLAWRLGGGTDRFLVNRDQLSDIQSFDGKFADAPIETMIAQIERSIKALRSNAQITLVFTQLALRLEEYCLQPTSGLMREVG